YRSNGQWMIYRHTNYYEIASKTISDSIVNHSDPVYHFPSAFPQITPEAIQNAPLLHRTYITRGGESGNYFTFQSDEYPSVSNHFEGIYLIVYNDENRYLFAANPLKNGRINMVTKGDYFKPGFFLTED